MQRPDFGSLWLLVKAVDTCACAYLKRDVLATQPDLELLTSILVLLRPFGVVLPGIESVSPFRLPDHVNILEDFAFLDNALDLSDQSVAHAH